MRIDDSENNRATNRFERFRNQSPPSRPATAFMRPAGLTGVMVAICGPSVSFQVQPGLSAYKIA
jgi:hypothetical protein